MCTSSDSRSTRRPAASGQDTTMTDRDTHDLLPRCECGTYTGQFCDQRADGTEMQYVAPADRQTALAAGGSRWRMARTLDVAAGCGEALAAHDPEWVRVDGECHR